MQLSFYLHDLHYEIGHANVTLNSIEFMEDIEQHSIKFVVFSHSPIETLFTKNINVEIHKVPFGNIKPVFFKILWFQFYTFFYALIFDSKSTKVSLGVASLICDISVIHFIHSQWNQMYFKILKPGGLKFLYKKIMYGYLGLCEKFLYKFKKTKIITVSKFLKDYMHSQFNIDLEDIQSIHSGFDLSRFKNSKKSQGEIKDLLTKENPVVKNLDLNRPILLFIGAFERKGLGNLLDKWKMYNGDAQLIVIGSPEGSSIFNTESTIHLKYTKHVNEFYEIADAFVFPTIYEPFGMVLIEAAVKGLDIYTTKEMVGASEVLSGIEGIKIYEDGSQFELPLVLKKLSSLDREDRINTRVTKLEQYNWINCAKKYKQAFERWSRK